MTTYTTINANQYDADSYTDVALMTALVNNVLAMFEGDASASGVRLQTLALADEIKPWIEIEQFVLAGNSTETFASLDVTNFDQYLITVESYRPSVDGATIILRVGTGGTPTIQTTGYNGRYHEWGHSDADDTYTSASNSTARIDLSPAGIGTAASEDFDSWIRFNNPEDATRYKRFIIESIWETGGDVESYMKNMSAWESATAVTAIEFSVSSGNLATGTITLYGRRK